MSQTPKELFQSGRLKDAIAAVTDQVRKTPTDANARTFLSELLLFSGDLDRADKQLDALTGSDPQAAVHVAMQRHLVRAEQARQRFHSDGAVPDFLEPPGERLQLLLRASIALREKEFAEAKSLLVQAEELFPALKGVCDGQPFVGLRDTDDLTATVFEVLAPNGKYYWIPMEAVASIAFKPPERPRDLLWRRAQISLKSGTETETLFPAVYAGSNVDPDERLALGHLTDWRAAADGAPVRGLGQRVLLVGDHDRAFLDLKTLTIEG